MKKTSQKEALQLAQEKYGPTAFTEDTVNYKRVGFVNPITKRLVKGIGKSWKVAFKVTDKHFKLIEKGKTNGVTETRP